jgi:hypothetical protein
MTREAPRGGTLLTVTTGGALCPTVTTDISTEPQVRVHPALDKRAPPAGFEPALTAPESTDSPSYDQRKLTT